ncbi:hypothetical protein [Buttiauxella sp. A111]|uniref:hypothetical protein n=1 Tax=Buttiauxella sp. A111 TaxID=2563088 RepID=UPI0010D36CE2|nr:hypothetical protein [Buttiauxella sp. A111]GDX07122.1 hypothetical protein BSPA111_33360 [Buttiauxella sp. A111]
MYTLDFSKKEIGRAGERIVLCASSNQTMDDSDLDKLHAWRMLHLYPLNRLKFYLGREAMVVDKKMLMSSRIKRLPSIINKLQRFPEMKLHKMQDLGGCRVILSNIEQVYSLEKKIKKLKFKHELVRTDDYMINVKESGYRSLHMIYSFKNDKHESLNGLRIEMQLRTAIQHSWATAVEMVGLFRKESLKSGQGDQSWLYFFQLVSDLFYRIESGNIIGRYNSISTELKVLSEKLNVFENLTAYNKFISHIEQSEKLKEDPDGLFIIIVDTNVKQITINNFTSQNHKAAAKKYKEAEKYCAENNGCEVAMVSVSDINDLRSAYPAYFLDTKTFLNNLGRFLF